MLFQNEYIHMMKRIFCMVTTKSKLWVIHYQGWKSNCTHIHGKHI